MRLIFINAIIRHFKAKETESKIHVLRKHEVDNQNISVFLILFNWTLDMKEKQINYINGLEPEWWCIFEYKHA